MGFLYKKRSVDFQAKRLAQYFPDARLFCAKKLPGSNLIQMIQGLAFEIFRSENIVNDMTFQHNMAETTDFIDEWEKALGIPDDCFTQTTSLTIEERRLQVLTKFTALSIATEADFIRLAQVLVPGVNINIVQAGEGVFFPLPFPLPFSASGKIARFTMIVELSTFLAPQVFPFVNKFPIPFSSNSGNIIECIFNKVKPANVVIQFRYIL